MFYLMVTLLIILLVIQYRKDLFVVEVKKLSKEDVLLQEYAELRGELKQRISQRDSYCSQCIVFSAAVLTATASTRNPWISLLFPLIVDFYYVLILESYEVHDRLVVFIREKLEETIASETGIEKDLLWEHYCEFDRDMTVSAAIGGRKIFFTIVALLSPVLAGLVLAFCKCNIVITIILYSFFQLANIVLIWFNSSRLQYSGLNKLAFRDYPKKIKCNDEVKKAIFLDKDGTLHVDRNMTHRLRDLELLPGAKDLVKRYHDAGYLVIIVTNQSAIGKGVYSIKTMHRFIWLLRKKLKYVDAVYYCPHRAGVACECRKPGTGMFRRAVSDFNIDLSQSLMVGDRLSDVEAGKHAGVGECILVKTGLSDDECNWCRNVNGLDEV